jgi:Putative rhamnosyl transferase
VTDTPGFEHILLTRFNVYYEDRGLPSDSWFQDRLQLFRRYTVASIRSQTVQPDKWLIFSHVLSPPWFKQQLVNLLATVRISDVIWMTETWEAALVSRLVGERLTPGTTRLLTTNIDNDDAVSRDFIEVIRAHCHDQAWEFLNLTRGAQCGNGKVYFRSDPANPFISLVENLSDAPPRTVFLDWHNRLPKYGPVRQIYTHPTWVQIVHGTNMQNAIHGIRAGADAIAPYFDVDLGILPVGRAELFADTIWTAIRLALRVVRQPHRILWALRVLRPITRLRGNR